VLQASLIASNHKICDAVHKELGDEIKPLFKTEIREKKSPHVEVTTCLQRVNS
jgi:hypothetical protein